MESEQQAAQEAPLEAPKKVYEMLPEMLHRCSLHFEDGASCVPYHSELQMPDIMRLIQKDLSEPYSIYTYRYFIHNWPKLCFLVCGTQFHIQLINEAILLITCLYT